MYYQRESASPSCQIKCQSNILHRQPQHTPTMTPTMTTYGWNLSEPRWGIEDCCGYSVLDRWVNSGQENGSLPPLCFNGGGRASMLGIIVPLWKPWSKSVKTLNQTTPRDVLLGLIEWIIMDFTVDRALSSGRVVLMHTVWRRRWHVVRFSILF